MAVFGKPVGEPAHGPEERQDFLHMVVDVVRFLADLHQGVDHRRIH